MIQAISHRTVERNHGVGIGRSRTILMVYGYSRIPIVNGGKSVLLAEYARALIVEEEKHLDAVNKMLRQPGHLEKFKPE